MHSPLQQIKQLQAWRGRPPRDLSITAVMDAAVEQAAKSHKKLGELIELWRELLPEEITSRSVLTGFRSGVLQVKVDSSPTMFEVDRLLRGGVELEMRRRFRGSLSRVKTRIGPLDEPNGAMSGGDRSQSQARNESHSPSASNPSQGRLRHKAARRKNVAGPQRDR